MPRLPATASRTPLRANWRWAAALIAFFLALWVVVSVATLPDPTELASAAPKVTALMLQREEAAQAAGRKARRRQSWVFLQQVSPQLVDAVLISEDAAFWSHRGVDFDELRKALAEAWQRKSLGRGASTITQQLAKNLYLSSDRSLLRKLKELALANRLERTLGKKRILTLYLNVVEWGDGVYGVEAGAREHFGLSAAQVSLAQAAVLAGMLPAPRRWLPRNRPPVLHRRATVIIERLHQTGRCTDAEAVAARAELNALFGRAPPPAVAGAPGDPLDEALRDESAAAAEDVEAEAAAE